MQESPDVTSPVYDLAGRDLDLGSVPGKNEGVYSVVTYWRI